MNDTTYVGMRYVPVFAEPSQWNISRQYENLMMVTNEGETYISKEFVPTGVELTNEDYWVKISVPSGEGRGINYSTEEQDTGLLWVDGRHIYQRTFTPNLTLNTSWQAVVEMTDIDWVTDIEYNITRDGEQAQPEFGGSDLVGWLVRNGYLNFSNNVTSSSTSVLVLKDVTIRYVKTSEIVA